MRRKHNADYVLYYWRIQGVLRVNEYYFPTRVAILTRQLSSDWKKKHTVAKIYCYLTQITWTMLCQKAECSSLFTHHRMCGTAVFSLYGILMLAALFKSSPWRFLYLIYYSSQTTFIKMKDVICLPPKASVMDILSIPPPNSLLWRLDISWKISTIYKYEQ